MAPEKTYTVGGILDGDLYSNTAIYGGWFLMPTELIAENSVSFNVSIRLIVKANDTGLEHTTTSLEKLVDMSDGLTLTTMQEAIASKEATIRQVGISIIGVTLFLLLFSIITFASTIITNIATKNARIRYASIHRYDLETNRKNWHYAKVVYWR